LTDPEQATAIVASNIHPTFFLTTRIMT